MNISIPDFGYGPQPKQYAVNSWDSPNPNNQNYNNQVQFELTNSPPLFTDIQDNKNSTPFNQIGNQTALMNQLQKLFFEIQSTKYSCGIQESELGYLKHKQEQLQKQIKKTQKKVKQKYQKQVEIKRSHKIQKQRKQKLQNGYRLLKKELCDMKNQEIHTRNKRMQAQQAKNKIYNQYISAEEGYRTLLQDLHDLQGIDDNVKEIQQQNQYLKENIQRIIDVLYGDQREEYYQERKNIRQQIKYLNDNVQNLEKQEIHLQRQIQGIENAQKAWQIERTKIKEKSDYGKRLYKKIQQLKTQLAQKRTQYAQIDSTYRQISIQENKLKKQMILERECREQQKRYKQKRKKQMEANNYAKQFTPRNQGIQTMMSRQKREISEEKKINDDQMRKLQKLFQRYQNVGKGC